MTDFIASKFKIDSALELVADSWSAVVPDSILFRNASIVDRVTLASGLLQGVGTPTTSPAIIQSITAGVIDEYELVITEKNIVGSVRGRDPSAAILDSFVDLGFARGPVAANEATVFTERLPSFQLPQVLPSDNVGRSRAQEIAKKAVEQVGLTLQWEVRDYEIVETFQASGRIIDILRRLVEPWTLLEPFKVDIYLQGSTVIVRHRQLPDQPMVATPQNTMSVAATRRSQLTVRKRPFKKIGKVTLRGRKKPQGLQTGVDLSGGGVFSSGTTTVEYVNESFDLAGNLVSRTVIQDQFRTPDRILLRSVKSTYTAIEEDAAGGLTLSTRENLENTWEQSIYDESGPVNAPKQLAQFVRREILDTEEEVFRDDATEETTYDYDDVGFLTGEITTTRRFNVEDEVMELETLVVKTVHDAGPLITEQIVETYRFDSDKKMWIIRSRTASLGGGHRPGGPGRGFGIAGIPNGAGADAFDFETLEQTFSTDKDAMPVEYSNENLTLADLQFIMSQFAATPGLFEYEFIFGGVAMPWLRRGIIIKFVSIQAEDGVNMIDLPAALITDLQSTFDESGPSPKYLMDARAFGWRTS